MVYPYLIGAFVPVGVVSAVYLVRKIREFQWGWIRDCYSLAGRIYIVTGANTGLGFETAKHLAARNATVIMACRSAERANEAIAKIRTKTANGHIVFMQLDLSLFDSIRKFASKLLTLYPKFDCLINNAGLATQTNQTTATGMELTFATNHLGHFLLTELLSDSIRKNSSRIVIVSSMLHQRGQIDFDNLGKCVDRPISSRKNVNYNDSKLANFYHARELYRKNFDVHVLCPGLCHTDFFRDYNPRWFHYILFAPVVWLMLRSAEQGAQNIIFAATDNVNTETKNPLTGYYIRSLKQSKSKYVFDDMVSERLWKESLNLCKSALVEQETSAPVNVDTS